MMTPNMQGIIMAIGKSSSIYEKNGPEAAFFKVPPLSFYLSSSHSLSLPLLCPHFYILVDICSSLVFKGESDIMIHPMQSDENPKFIFLYVNITDLKMGIEKTLSSESLS